MTGRIHDFRAAFDKAAVIISPNGFSAVYANSDDEWVYQPEEENGELYSAIFHELLESSSGFLIKFRKGLSVALEFRMEIGVDNAVFYQPLNHELSYEELQEVTSGVFHDSVRKKEFIEFFSGADLSDDDEVARKLKSWVESHRTEDDNIVSLPRKIRFDNMVRVLQKNQANGVECVELFEPEGKEDGGFFTLYFDCNKPMPTGFFGKSKDDFAELFTVSKGVAFEANIKEGFVNLSFFA